MTCARCEVLSDEVAYLKSELGLVRSSSSELELHRLFGLTAKEARFLIAVYKAKGRVLSRFQILEAIGSFETESNLISAYACNIRKKVARDALLTEWGYGFSIGPSGRAAVEAAKPMQVAA